MLVHSSLSSFGYVEGGADTVIDALLEVVGSAGTVLVPTLTGDETLSTGNPPTFDPVNTACWTGRIPETLRKRTSAIRSVHPTHSVAAIGADAPLLTKDHQFSITPCDESSPYYKLAHVEGGCILLIGVDHESNTSFHCAEELVGVDYHMQQGFARAKIIMGDREIYRHYRLHRYGSPRHFNVLAPIFEERGIQISGTIGNATVRLLQADRALGVMVRCLTVDRQIFLR